MLDIYGTLGPACANPNTLAEMFAAGMTGVRLNLSHVSLSQAAGQIAALHEAAARCGKQAQLLIDMQGPELRIGTLPEPLTLEDGSEVLLGEGGLSVPAMILPHLFPGQKILLDDGKILLQVRSAATDSARAEILRGGVLTSRKSIALSGSRLHPPTMTERDLENIACARAFGVTAVMQPFVRDRADLEAVRQALIDAGCGHIRLFAKIENMEGVSHLDELIPACDEIVIARGDLGNAMPLCQLPRLQKEIAAKCRAAGRAFMVVTQMLASMEHSPVPTRAEVSDIFNAVCDGAASVMVTGETAVGSYPVEVIRYLAGTAAEALAYRDRMGRS